MTQLVLIESKAGVWDEYELVDSEEQLKKAVEHARSLPSTSGVTLSIFDISLVKQYKFPGVNNGEARGTED